MKTPTKMIMKAFVLFLALGMMAALVGCVNSSSVSSSTTTISATSGTSQSVQVGAPFAVLTATVTSNSNPSSGAMVTFTAPASGASCVFASNSMSTETDPTDSSGVATSSVCTADTDAGAYSVIATVSGSASTATFNLTNTAGPAAILTATTGASQYVTVGTAPASVLVANVTDADGNPLPGVTVNFTAPSAGASGTFGSTGNNAEPGVVTDANGNATASDFVANTTQGSYNIVATSTGLPSADFALTNAASPVADGNYVFSLNGTDGVSAYSVAGVITVSGGAIVNGEQDFVDWNVALVQDSINPVGSAITATADGNFQITLTTCFLSDCTQTDADLGGGTGVEVINGAFFPLNPNRGFINEFDSSAVSSGEFDAQDATAAGTNLLSGYAFGVGGVDVNDNPLVIGGVINVDGTGTISGAGSIFDANDDFSGTNFQGETLTGSTVSAPDSFGRVLFTLNATDTADFPQMMFAGYIVDANTIRLVESADAYSGTLGGAARSQGGNTGTFSASSINGASYVASMYGGDANGALQSAGVLTFSSSGTLAGFIDFNDLTGSEPTIPDPVSAPAFTVDATGRVTVAGVTDGANLSVNLQMYLDGSGHAYVLSMDSGDAIGGFSVLQTSASLSDANFNNTYAMDTGGIDGALSGQFSTIGTVSGSGTGDTFSGFADFNWLFNFNLTDEVVDGTYALSTPGILSPGTVTGLDFDSGFANADVVDIYLIDAGGDSVLIETDSSQLMLGAMVQQ